MMPLPVAVRARTLARARHACLVVALLSACTSTLGAGGHDREPEDSRVAASVPARATVLANVGTSVVNGRVQITLRGNGRLEPRMVRLAEDLPPRLFLDLPDVDFTVPPVVRVGTGDVRRVRVAANSVSPPVTRVVVDLQRAMHYEMSRNGAGDLVITVGEERGVEAPSGPGAAPASELSTPAPARATELAAPPRAPAVVRSASAAAPASEPSAPAPAPSASPAIVPSAPAAARATQLSGVRVEVVAGRVEVSLRGNGRLEPSTVEYARDLPPRLLLDLPGVRSNVLPVAHVSRGDVRRVRVAANSLVPLVTRVVVDLARQVPYEVSRRGAGGDDLVITLAGDSSGRPDAALTRSAAGPDENIPAADPALIPTGTLEAADTSAPTPDTGSEPSRTPVGVAAAADDAPPASAPAPLQWATQSTPDPASQKAASTKRRRTSQSAGGGRNVAPGGRPRLLQLRSLRTAFGVGYELVGTRVQDGGIHDYEDRMTSPIATIQGGMSIIDPRILSIDGWADLRFNWRQYDSDLLVSRTQDTLQNYRVNLLIMSGRPAPLNVYFQRVDLFLDQRQNALPANTFLDLSQAGVQTTRGFSWEVTPHKKLPHLVAAGDLTDRRDDGSFLAGWNSRSRQQRLEVRADQGSGAARYEASFSHERSKYDYPVAKISSDYAIDLLRGTTTTVVRPGLTVDGGARLTRYSFTGLDLLQRQRDLVSAGGFAGFSWSWSPRWRANARYNATSNESDIALAADPEAGGPDAGSGPGLTARRRFLYQDFDARVSYSPGARGLVTSVFTRGLSLDPVQFVAPTLSTLRLVGLQVDAGRSKGRLDFLAGAEGALGRSSSNRGDTQPYREVAARARIGGRFSRATLSGNGGFRWNDGSYFYPVAGHTWYGGLEMSADLARELRMRASAARTFLLRDVVFQRGDDSTDAFSAGVSGSRYEIVVDYADTRSSAAGLLETTLLLEPRPDLALAARPELYGFLYASRQVLRGATVRLTVLQGLDFVGRGRLDQIQRPSSVAGFDLEQTVAQVGAVWGVRQMQAELGWEYLDYRTALVSTTNRRFYVRVRRDLPLF